MALQILNQVDAALGQQQILNVNIAKCLIEVAKLLPADEPRLPLTGALQSVADSVSLQNAVLVKLRELLMVEVCNVE